MRRALAGALLAAGAMALAGAGARTVYAKRKIDTLQMRALPLQLEGSVPARLLLIGDSRIAQWPLGALPAGAAKAGYPGATTPSIANVAPAAVAQAKAPVVLVQMGYNDSTAAAFLPPAEALRSADMAVARVRSVADAARAAGATRIVVMTVAPANHPPLWRRWLYASRQERLIARMNARLRQLSEAEKLLLLDADRLMRGADGGMEPRYRTDPTHWSPAAYAMLHRELTALLAKADRRGDSEP